MNGLPDSRTLFAVESPAALECLPMFLAVTANAAAAMVALRPADAQDAVIAWAAEALLLRCVGGAGWEQRPPNLQTFSSADVQAAFRRTSQPAVQGRVVAGAAAATTPTAASRFA